jgi:hypothetical protein
VRRFTLVNFFTKYLWLIVGMARGLPDRIIRNEYPKETAMPVSIHPLHPVFAGAVTGVDCRAPLSSAEVAALEAGMDHYAVLVFRDQNITDEEQIAFTCHFGELESHTTAGHIRRREEQRLGAGMAGSGKVFAALRAGHPVLGGQH